MLIVLN